MTFEKDPGQPQPVAQLRGSASNAVSVMAAGALLVLLMFSTSGCALLPPDYGYKRPFAFGPDKQKLAEYKSGAFRVTYDAFARQGVTNQEKSAEARLERNRIVTELLYSIDAAHGQFTRDSLANKGWLDVGSDFAILGLSGAGAVVGGAGTKAILAAIVGGVQGAQLTVNKRVFREQAIEALEAEMSAAMMARKAEILERMKKSVDEYSLDLALSDIVEYYYDGTFTRAFQNLVAQAKQQQTESEKAVKKAIRPEAAAPSAGPVAPTEASKNP